MSKEKVIGYIVGAVVIVSIILISSSIDTVSP